MHSQGFLAKPSHSPTSFGLAFTITGAGLAALLLATPYIKTLTHDDPMDVIEVRPPTPADPVPLPPVAEPLKKTLVDRPLDNPPVTSADSSTDLTGTTPTDSFAGAGGDDIFRSGPVAIQDPPPVPMPVLTEARYDMRFATSQQPPYPAAQQREEIEGSVTVRVRIGTDGRVLAVESVRATNEAFFASTREWALRKWRFKPATRDGVAVESWRTMSVRFTIDR